MRKYFVLMVMILVMISSTGVCHAAAIEDNQVDLQYIGTYSHYESISNKIGTLNFYGQLTPKADDSYDKVKITLKVVNFVTNATVHIETKEVSYDTLYGYFIAESSCTAPTLGTYYLDVTYKCYKNGTLIETITGQSKLLSI